MRLPLLLSVLLFLHLICWAQEDAQLSSTQEESIVVELKTLTVDDAGMDMRRALQAWEREPATTTQIWQPLDLEEGESIPLGTQDHILLLSGTSAGSEILIINADGPQRIKLRVGQQTTASPYDVLLVGSQRGRASVMIRLEGEATSVPRSAEAIQILGYEQPNRLEVVSNQPGALEFAELYLEQRNKGAFHESAYAAALIATSEPTLSLPKRGLPEDDSFDFGNDPLPTQALITFRVIRGSESAFQALSGAGSYRSDAPNNPSPPIRAKSDGAGGQVIVGRPGDRFQYELKALESKGSVRVESESFVRVLVGENGRYSFNGPGGNASGDVYTRRRGRGVEVSFSQGSGDRSGFGITNSRLVFQNGQTLQVAKNSSSRTTSSKSGTPIIQDIPYIGPGLGSSQSSQDSESYALYVTVELE